MVVETKTRSEESAPPSLDALARRHPGVVTAILAVLAGIVTAALLFQSGSTFVLYQGF